MPYADATKLNKPDKKEDDGLACASVMSPELQRILDKRYSGDAFMCAMATTYAELVRSRGGQEEPLLKAMEMFASLPRRARREVPLCHSDLKAMNRRIHAQGFSDDAIMWSMIGAVMNILGQAGTPQAEIDECRNRMIMHLNEARKSSMD